MNLHPLSAIFPRMDSDAFELLKADLKANGQRQPITILGGMILDGGHRYRACTELGIEPKLVEFEGSDPIAFVISANMHRRHMTPSQSAMVAASLANMQSGGTGANQHNDGCRSANLQSSVSQSQAADMLQVSVRTVASAARVIDSGTPELVEAVKAGTVSVSKAAKIATLPKPEQAAAMAAPKATKSAATDPPEDDLQQRYDDLLGDYKHEVAENEKLQERIKALTAGDPKAEVDKALLRIHALEGRLQQAMTTSAEAQRQATYYGKLLTAIRKELDAPDNQSILQKIRAQEVAF